MPHAPKKALPSSYAPQNCNRKHSESFSFLFFPAEYLPAGSAFYKDLFPVPSTDSVWGVHGRPVSPSPLLPDEQANSSALAMM